MTDEIVIEEPTKETAIFKRDSGQDIANPRPPQLPPVTYVGTKSDAESWRRTKDKNYLKKRARQLITAGSQDKGLISIIKSRRG